jgi:hypothetical protein
MKKFALVFLAFVFGSFLFFNAPQAQAYTIGFYKITNNSSSDVSGQLSVDVNAVGQLTDDVSFRFLNNVGIASSITEIYFDDGTGIGTGTLFSTIVGLENSSGVNFVQDSIKKVNPQNLPGGNDLSPPFETTPGFSAGVDGNTAAGINAAGEFVTIIFDLKDGKDIDDVLDAINSLDLRIGLHVRAHPDGNSDGYVNVPVPAAAWLLGSGLLGLVAIRRRVKK